MELLVPQNEKDEEIFLSIVIPALNEEISIEKFIDWCKAGINKSKVNAEILIIDSSNDNTAELAFKKGARVLKTFKRGLGRAYIDSLKYIRGKYILMGDCDLTYDFRDLNEFVDAFKKGYDFVMGSRFKGFIEPNSMPLLHRYFGTPITTFILNFIYRSNFSDIHCGMRGISKKAFEKIALKSQGWEYASEMIVKAIRMKLHSTEVPVKFYKDPPGRFSHHVRSGFWSPWYAGWINLKVMFVYTLDTFMFKPGIFLFFTGLIFFAKSLINAIFDQNYFFGLTTLSFFMILLGQQLFTSSIIARLQHNYRKGFELKILKHLTYDFGMGLSFIIFFSSFVLFCISILCYFTSTKSLFIYTCLIFGFTSVMSILSALFVIFIEFIRLRR